MTAGEHDEGRALHRGTGDTFRQPERPEILDMDMDSQFTSPRLTQILLDAAVKVFMDGRGR